MRPTPAEEDPIVHRFLGTLPRPEVSPVFETRVLKRIWRPVPPTVRDRWDRFIGSWSLKLFLTALAAGAFLWQAALVGVALQFPAEARELLTVGARETLPIVVDEAARLWGVVLASVKAWLAAWVAGHLGWLIGALFVILVSAVGLIWVLRSGRMSHVWQ